MKTEDLYSEIVKELEAKGDARLARLDKYYHKVSGYKSYGIRGPEFGELIKARRTVFKQLSLPERLQLARMLFKSGFSEQGTYGIVVLSQGVEEMEPSHLGFLDEMAGHLNNWATTDGFCMAVVQPLLLAHPRETLRLLSKWNRSESLWKRRASVVAFTRKVGAGGEFTDEALELCDSLIWDGEDMVRKGVGWALNDCMRGDKTKVVDYVKGLRQKGVSSVITLYAMRDLKGNERKQVLTIKSQI